MLRDAGPGKSIKSGHRLSNSREPNDVKYFTLYRARIVKLRSAVQKENQRKKCGETRFKLFNPRSRGSILRIMIKYRSISA